MKSFYISIFILFLVEMRHLIIDLNYHVITNVREIKKYS